MKNTGSILNAIVINLVLLITFISTVNPFNLTISEIFSRKLEWLFSPDPIYNIIMIGSFVGLISFNVSLVRNRK